jgi:Rieske Fe-S protein
MATVEHSDTPTGGAREIHVGPPGGGGEGEGVRRRDFINIAAVSFAGVGAATLVYPLVNQMNPSADVLALASIEVDVSSIQPGQAIKTIWRKQPVFIRNLTQAEVQQAAAVPLGGLRDPQTLAERTKEGKNNSAAFPWAPRRVRTKANMAAISARATAPTTTPPGGSAKAQRQQISKCRTMNSCPIPWSRSAEGRPR